MAHISILAEQLIDEYFRCERNLRIQKEYLEKNEIHGYISKKIIRGRTCYYLQWRDGAHIKSKYIPQDIVPLLQDKIDKNKSWKASIKSLERDMKLIEKMIGEEIINERR